ncbi:MAG: bifunctional phosphopantothenoylcysteine decarboxylase/phosphopantothenate synthase [ANME-2 cluster archaeon HR1]|nr:MAG: bifunctional phosphopantothenoylcysteine decarboxylase/phosphopantothenate synthase [ANME-2 cluster archaeon HR1]
MTMTDHPTQQIYQTLSDTLHNKTIILAVTGSIAAVRTIELSRELIRHGARIKAVMSSAATNIIHPDALHYATASPVITRISGAVEHVEYCGEEGSADLLLIAPCTANTISKIAVGIDDTPVTTFATTALGSGKQILIVPAMHGSMYNHLAIRDNIDKLRAMGIHIIDPVIEEHSAKIAANEDIVLVVRRLLGDGRLNNKRIIITGGGTMERIDPIRILTSRASGLTGIALAQESYYRGADVVLIHPKKRELYGITEIEAVSTCDMICCVLDEIKKGCDLLISSAAISDYTVKPEAMKIPSQQNELTLTLYPTPKLLQTVREDFPGLPVIGFKALANVSKEQLLISAQNLMKKNGLSMVVANDVGKEGMGSNENTVCILDSSGIGTGPVSGNKTAIARTIIDRIIEVWGC